MKQFHVTLYSVGEIEEHPALALPLTQVFSGGIEAENERFAAAIAWVNEVGKDRLAQLQNVVEVHSVPEAVKLLMVEPKFVEPDLRETSLCSTEVKGFLFDVLTDVWLIGVTG